mmetsp:Transcript_110959/g.254312  ORF Transcript_110959/g.254312 Transcript_110959/m.254312 type:complete len:936 (+) Transcript_110959:188-2995(+)
MRGYFCVAALVGALEDQWSELLQHDFLGDDIVREEDFQGDEVLQRVLPRVPGELRELLQQTYGEDLPTHVADLNGTRSVHVHAQSELQENENRFNSSKVLPQRPFALVGAHSHVFVNATVKRIFAILNAMIVEDQNKLTIKTFDCKKTHAHFKSMYRANRDDLHSTSYALGTATSQQQRGGIQQNGATTRLGGLYAQLDKVNKTCSSDLQSLRFRLSKADRDLVIAAKIAGGTSCAKPGQASLLQQCIRMAENGQLQNGWEVAAQSEGAQLATLLTTRTARAGLKRILNGEAPAPQKVSLLAASEQGEDDGGDALMGRDEQFDDYYFTSEDGEFSARLVPGAYRRTLEDRQAHELVTAEIASFNQEKLENILDLDDSDAPAGAWIHFPEGTALLVKNTSLPPEPEATPKAKADAKYFCTAATNPNCPRVRDRLEGLVSEIQDDKDLLIRQIASTLAECDSNKGNLEVQINDAVVLKNDGAELEQSASAVVSDSDNKVKLIEREGRTILSEWKQSTNQCNAEIMELRAELCGTKKMKGQVLAMNAKKGAEPIAVNDCQVSDWTPGECHDPTGQQKVFKCNPNGEGNGGQMIYSRSAVSPTQTPELGAPCPPLALRVSCNNIPCPVNCKMGDWSEWSTCTKKCDGGMKRRSRNIEMYPASAGESCPPDSEEETCNAMSCDRDCLLNDWSPWRACTRACDGGMRWRSRTVKHGARGGGKCAKKFAKARYHTEKCNNDPCPRNATCIAKVDLILMIDSSGSMGESGFKAQRQAVLGLLDSAHLNNETGMQIGLIAYSKAVHVLSSLSANKADLVKAVGTMKFDAWTTNTGGALRTAAVMLQGSRKGVASVCQLWTDGRPSRPSSRLDALGSAEDLRRTCRVMVVSLRPAMPESFITPWVSHPHSANLISLKHPTEIADKVQQLWQATCPALQRTATLPR